MTKSVMEEAQEIVNGERASSYGHPKTNFDRICCLWDSYLRGRPDGAGGYITSKDHAILMILVKIARLQESPNHRDSLVDICGYAGTYEKLIQKEEEDDANLTAAYVKLARAIQDESEDWYEDEEIDCD